MLLRLTVELRQLELRCRGRISHRDFELQIKLVLQQVVDIPGQSSGQREQSTRRNAARDTHQHFPVHLVPVLSDAMVNQSLSFALFHCKRSRGVKRRRQAHEALGAAQRSVHGATRHAASCTEQAQAASLGRWRRRCARANPWRRDVSAAHLHVFDERLVLLL